MRAGGENGEAGGGKGGEAGGGRQWLRRRQRRVAASMASQRPFTRGEKE